MIHTSSVERLRLQVAEASKNIIGGDTAASVRRRKAVLRGDISTSEATSLWKTPSFKLLVFVSSTFTDSKFERNYLMDELLFDIREDGLRHGISVTFVDMRWGIRDENTCDHKTWIECASAISLCKEESAGVCFLSLQGNKYGYRPLPRSILQTDLDAHVFQANLSPELRQLVYDWYVLDDNAVPKEYVLCSLAELDDAEYWHKAYKPMLEALAGVGFDTRRYTGLQVGMSITEWEVRAALSDYPIDVKNRGEGALLWSFRNLEGNFVDYPDFHDEESAQRRKALVSFMKTQFPRPDLSIREHKVDIQAVISDDKGDGQFFAERKAYEDDCKTFLASMLRQSLQDIIIAKQQWSADANGLGLPGAVVAEMLHHAEWTAKKCAGFFGRADLVDKTVALLRGGSHRGGGSEYAGISAYIVGISGSGKTALMAKVASEMYKQQSSQAQDDLPSDLTPVIIRFCGTSPASSNARDLVVSICAQIELVYEINDMKAFEAGGGGYGKLLAYFHSLLLRYPVVLFIDSLDQLSDDDEGRSEISFLKEIKQSHPQTRVVVSCLPDEFEVNPLTGKRYVYMCETRLKQGQVPRVDLAASMGYQLQDALSMLDQLLHRQGRTLSGGQRRVIRDRMENETQAPTALYVNMMAWIVSRWTSQVSAASHLTSEGGGVQSLVWQIFAWLERDFGSQLVRAVLGILTLSVHGVTDTELEDVLSLNDAVLDSVFVYCTPRVRRLPSHVWIRLKTALSGLIVDGQEGCIMWYHRQLQEAAFVYLSVEEKIKLHELMATYFGNLTDEGTRQSRKILRHTWTVCGRSPFHKDSEVNRRRCTEASHHFLRSSNQFLLRAEDELCSFAGAVCKLRVGLGFQLISDLATLAKTSVASYLAAELCTSQEAALSHIKRASDYLRWLRKDIYTLLPDAASTFLTAADSQSSLSTVKLDAIALWQQLSGSFTDIQATSVMFAPIIGDQQEADDLMITLKGHKTPVLSVSVSPDGRFIASAGSNPDGSVMLWDAFTGQKVLACERHGVGWSAYSLQFDPSGQRLAGLLKLIRSDGVDCEVCVWQVETGLSLCKFNLDHAGQTLCYSPDGTQLLVSMILDRRAVEANKKRPSHTCLVIDSSTGQTFMRLGDGKTSTHLALYHPNGRTILYATQAKSAFSIVLCSANDGEITFEQEFENSKVQSLAFNRNGTMMASNCHGEPVKIWSVEDDQVMLLAFCVLPSAELAVRSVVFSPDGSTLVGVSALPGKAVIYVWNTAGKLLRMIYGQNQMISQIYFSPNGRELVCASGDNTVKIFDVSRARSVSEEGDKRSHHLRPLVALSFSVHDKALFSLGQEGQVNVWDIEANSVVKSIHLNMLVRMDHWDMSSVKSMHYCHENSSAICHLVVTCTEGPSLGYEETKVCLFDTKGAWQCRSVLYSTKDPLASVCICDIGQRVAFCSDEGSIITIINIDDAIKENELEQESTTYSALCFSPDGCSIVSACTKLGDFDLLVWNIADRQVSLKFSGHSEWIGSVCYTSDGCKVASACNDKTVRVWSIQLGCLLQVLQHYTWVTCISFSATGDRLASGSGTCVRLWDCSSGKLVASISGQEHRVSSLQFSQGGNVVALGSSFDFRVRLWNIHYC